MCNEDSAAGGRLGLSVGDAGGVGLGIVLDFDGTITDRDIGDKVIQRFAAAGWEEGLEHLRSGEWSIGKLQRWEAERLPADRLAEMEAYALEIGRIRPGLKELVDFAGHNDICIEVASAGFEFYVRAILERDGFGDLRTAVPRVVFGDGRGPTQKPRLEFPAGLATCERVGLCKCERVWRLQREGRRALFVGDGMSDYCVAEQADLVFARGSLARYCRERNIPHVVYEDFTQVLAEVRRQLNGQVGLP
ncbi:MAG: MtnX-like HAD-IB family phosphatase [Chloroflexi bacterium]|nr:MtnX-like HAD-IB family phosphatase [Chloroflexota bacterium]